MKIFIKESLNRFITVKYDNEYNEELEELEIDEYEAADQAEEIARKEGVRILRNKELNDLLIDVAKKEIIGASWISIDDNIFSFDIAIDSLYQGKGLATQLLDKLMSEYEFQEEMHDDLKIELDVINPKLAQILKTKYGFKVLQKIGPDRVIMGL